MAFSDVQAKTTITGFKSAADRAIILNALRTAYNGSSLARTMFDDWIATPANTIKIQYEKNKAISRNSPSGKVFLDLQLVSKLNYITPTGQAVKLDPVHVIVHELGHALTGRRDITPTDGGFLIDYKGANVIYTNPMLAQLGIPERISYVAAGLDVTSGGVLKRNFQYTNGATIDRAVSRDRNWSMSLLTGNSRDLLIGGPSANILQGRAGDDFLWGLGGDDKLYGGFGIDTTGFMGKPTDYDLRLNPDGSWTSRHVRGTKDEGEDKLINIQKVVFEGGQTFNLRKKGLTYQSDFALVIDTTGSMGSSIGAVKANGTAIINALFADDTKDARIGIVGFKDTTIGEPTSIILKFTDQPQFADRKAAALNALNGISVSGGGDIPETAFDGLLKALDGTMGDWRPGAGVHRVVLFTDAPAKDRSLKSTVASYAANIGATITASSRAVGTSGSIDSFTLSPIPLASTETERFYPGSGDDDPDLPPFEFIDESPTPDTSIANLEIYTIYTGDFDSLDPDLESIATTTGGRSFATPNPDDLVNTLLTIIDLPPTNTAPTAVNLNNTITELAENSGVGTGIKVADIVIIDDALGNNILSLTGTDFDTFEIRDNELFYMGESPDFESKNQYQVTVNVQDLSLGDEVFARNDFTLTILDVNEPPTAVNLITVITELEENTGIGDGIKVADIAIVDDALGDNLLSLTDTDADSFEIRGNALFFIGASPDFETKNKYDVTVNVDDPTVGATPDASTNFSLAITNVPDTPDELLNTSFNRFQNSDRPGTYLFAGPEESQNIRNNYPAFSEEGFAFKVAVEANDDLIRINRFQNTDVLGTYLFAGEQESQSIRQNFPNFVEEGIAFYVYDGNAGKGVDFYRFQNTQQSGTYIFVGEEEKNSILANFPQFQLEGVAFEVVA